LSRTYLGTRRSTRTLATPCQRIPQQISQETKAKTAIMSSVILTTTDVIRAFQNRGRTVPTSPLLAQITAKRNEFNILMEQAFKEGARKAQDEANLAQLIRACERDLQERALKEESDSDEEMDSDIDSSDTMDQAPSDYGWDEEDTEVEPLPQSVYSGTPPPKAPTPPPVRFPGFNWSEPETDYDT